jgi:hypothetical protein
MRLFSILEVRHASSDRSLSAISTDDNISMAYVLESSQNQHLSFF